MHPSGKTYTYEALSINLIVQSTIVNEVISNSYANF